MINHNINAMALMDQIAQTDQPGLRVIPPRRSVTRRRANEPLHYIIQRTDHTGTHEYSVLIDPDHPSRVEVWITGGPDREPEPRDLMDPSEALRLIMGDPG